MQLPMPAMVMAIVLAASAARGAESWVVYEGGVGPGKGKHVVLISGDETYRSEEALPQLGKILTTHHGFTCTVLFAIDPKTGQIHPGNLYHIPGLQALESADLMIIATRFRDLPDDQLRHIDDYLRSGRPVIGMRCATHAFNVKKHPAWAHYSFRYDGDKKPWTGGFGYVVLGGNLIGHHGHHKIQGTRGVIAPGGGAHPILRGIKDGEIRGPSSVYEVQLRLHGDSRPIVLGQVLEGVDPEDHPVQSKKNDPMMPVAWTRTYQLPDGKKGRVFTTTMGAATDLLAKGTRRMLINAVYWAVGMADQIPAGGTKVGLVGEFNPAAEGYYGFTKGVKPSDHMLSRARSSRTPNPEP